jgi:hypothetical protein
VLTVATVLRSGGIYDAKWVERLAAGVARHLPIEHRFVCLSDVDVPCERIPLRHDWPGWWAKMELYSVPGPLLYFDLDTVIVGDLSDLGHWAKAKGISALRDFYRPDGFGSGVLSWNDCALPRDLYQAFSAQPDEIMRELGGRGDQGFIEDEHVPAWRLQIFHPGQIVSYKVHCLGGIPAGARVICLHGLPKFSDMPVNDPVRQAWEMAA